MNKNKPMLDSILNRDSWANKFVHDLADVNFGGERSRENDRADLYQKVYVSALMGAATLLDGPDADVAKEARKLCRRAAILASTAIDDDEMMWHSKSEMRFVSWSDMPAYLKHLDGKDAAMEKKKDDPLEGGQRRHEQGSQPLGKPLTSEPIGKPPESKPLHKDPEGEPFRK